MITLAFLLSYLPLSLIISLCIVTIESLIITVLTNSGPNYTYKDILLFIFWPVYVGILLGFVIRAILTIIIATFAKLLKLL